MSNKQKMTIRELIDLKGKRKIIVVNAKDYYTAKACELTGIDNIVAGTDPKIVKAVSEAAPNTLITGALTFRDARISDQKAIESAINLMESGADIIYTMGATPERVRALSKENIACVGHVGLVPYLSTWVGGFRAVGKTSEEALRVYIDTIRLQEAGAIAVEMECVPHKVAAEITKRVKILTFSMGSGPDCDGQYLFACDLLGSHDGHYPRHAIVYGDFFRQSINIFKQFKGDVNTGTYPMQKHVINISDDEFEKFMDKIEKTGGS
ncbi:MAG: 3-methyl-2-oxobutanoate hydroxymethyltransferase [Acetivibrionales bacterium]|jgi:3-methyl-2-oxobutanoate hydroxymethyltransferase